MAEFHIRLMEASQKESNVTSEFLVRGLVIHFAGIFHLCCSVQNLFKNNSGVNLWLIRLQSWLSIVVDLKSVFITFF
jgi:hypothetical protein